jgi:hypothetical protein
MSDLLVNDITVKNPGSITAVSIGLSSGVELLQSRVHAGAQIDPSKHPGGYQYKSVTLRNVVVEGENSQNGIFLSGKCDNVTIENCLITYEAAENNRHCQPITIASGSSIDTLTIRNLVLGKIVSPRGIFLSGAVKVNKIVIENCQTQLSLFAENDNHFIGDVVVTNSPYFSTGLVKINSRIMSKPDPSIVLESMRRDLDSLKDSLDKLTKALL